MPDWISVVLKTLAAVVALLIMTRLLGKRQVSQLSPFEYVTGITIGSLAAYIPLETQIPWYLGLVSLFVWFLVALGIEYLQLSSNTIREWIDGRSVMLISQGKVLEKNLRQERITVSELMSHLRNKNVFNLDDVEFAVMEPDGAINVQLKPDRRPLTLQALGIHRAGREHFPRIVIMEGTVLERPLAKLGLDRNWLNKELAKADKKLEDVFLAQVDSQGNLHIDLYDSPSS
ncbi:DUF421 domain-containing protein [Staphylospora marina]|uniref:DUF421 domain-containing protein n=1 Tax=Staphylospora marina TaxID=2490858 RepID=UPI000F5B9581|nr:DUF421 domain-containing protein [Staphylospora marina]